MTAIARSTPHLKACTDIFDESAVPAAAFCYRIHCKKQPADSPVPEDNFRFSKTHIL
jgi:hypothetical protein